MARLLIRRSILCDAVYELWGVGADYESLHQDVQRRTEHLRQKYRQDSFRFSVHGFQGKRTKPEQGQIIESFSYLGFEGPIRMRGAAQEFAVYEQYTFKANAPSVIYFGRFISVGDRSVVAKYDLKKRKYISTTSMDSELALVTANMALAAPGKLVFDPFVGTGSFPIACGHFGATALGSDIDGRPVRGTAKNNIQSSFAQYNLDSHWLDGFVSDLTNTPMQARRFLDAIICDPPYGVREGLKVLGMRNGNPTEPVYIDGVASYLYVMLGSKVATPLLTSSRRPEFVPPKKPYSFDAMLDDILDFAAQTLVENGRLCMWMPTANDDDIELAIPQHPAFQLVAVCVQDFRRCTFCQFDMWCNALTNIYKGREDY